MQGLKNFIISEETKISHSERYLSFLDRYHSQVFFDLKTTLEKSWHSLIESLSKKYPVSAEAIEDVMLRNPRATTELTLGSSHETLVTARSRTPQEISLSVKVPFVYSVHDRHLLTKLILDNSKTVLENVANQWKAVFNYEHKGKLQPWFKILHDSEEIRFQLAVGNGQSESFKTLYSVRIEYGKNGSKLKDFDRIYLHSSI